MSDNIIISLTIPPTSDPKMTDHPTPHGEPVINPRVTFDCNPNWQMAKTATQENLLHPQSWVCRKTHPLWTTRVESIAQCKGRSWNNSETSPSQSRTVICHSCMDRIGMAPCIVRRITKCRFMVRLLQEIYLDLNKKSRLSKLDHPLLKKLSLLALSITSSTTESRRSGIS